MQVPVGAQGDEGELLARTVEVEGRLVLELGGAEPVMTGPHVQVLVADAGPEPVADAGPEPVADAGPEPVADAGPEPVADAAADSAGPGPGPDASAEGTGSSDIAADVGTGPTPPGETDEGCATGQSPAGQWVLGLLLIGGLALSRRRRWV